MVFKSPLFLGALFLLIWLYLKRDFTRQSVPVLFPNADLLSALQDPKAVFLSKIRVVLRFLSLAVIIVALSNPVMIKEKTIIDTSQLDTMIVLDTSLSMMAEDFSPNRLEAVQQGLRSFLTSYRGRIGIIEYAKNAVTLSPLTDNKRFVKQQVSALTVTRLEDGGAYTNAILLGLQRLTHSEALNKQLILISDGKSTDERVSPEEVISVAKELGVRISSLAIGKKGGAQVPIYDPKEGRHYLRHPKTRALIRTQLDSEVVKLISDETKGLFFRVYNDKQLEKAFQDLVMDAKSWVPVDKKKMEQPLFPGLIVIAIVLIFIELSLRYLVLVAIP